MKGKLAKQEPIKPKEVNIVEDSQMDTQDNEALLQEMVRDVERAGEPGDLAQNPVVHKGDDNVPVPMVGRVQSAGYVLLYSTRTGATSKFNRNALRGKLQQRWSDDPLRGEFKWSGRSVENPPHPVKEGTFKCLLHKDDPNREHYDNIGLAVCPKDNLASPYQVTRHMQKRHKDEWGGIEQERKNAEKKEEKEFQRSLISGMKPPLYISDKDKKAREKIK